MVEVEAVVEVGVEAGVGAAPPSPPDVHNYGRTWHHRPAGFRNLHSIS